MLDPERTSLETLEACINTLYRTNYNTTANEMHNVSLHRFYIRKVYT
jgi:hypothetical protein